MKTFERLIKNRLEHWLERNKLLPPSQFGFRQGRSTQEATSVLITDIQLAFTKNKTLTALFLDIKGAYDNVLLDVLAVKLLRVGIPKNIVHILINMYTNRLIHIKINDSIIGPRSTSVGLPQGSILSPLLYIIYSLDFGSNFSNNSKIIQFADDICIYSENDTFEQGIDKLYQTMEKVKSWADENGLIISENKSIACTFTRKRTQLPSVIKLGPYEIPHKTTVKYLGISLDKKLLWKDHINQIIKKTENSINIIRVFSRSTWGADPNIALLFYKSLVRSIIDYGSIFYGTAADIHLQKIDRVKYKCLRLCLGLLKSTPINVIEVETCEPPLNLRRQLLSDKFISKNVSKKSDCINNLHTLMTLSLTSPYWILRKTTLMINSYLKILENSQHCYKSDLLPCYEVDYEDLLKEIKTHYLKIDTSPHTNQIFQYEIEKRWPNYEFIFTDGSKKEHKTGCAFYHLNIKKGEKFKMPKSASIYTAELFAVQKAMEYANTLEKTNFVIFTDSKSLVDKLKSATYNKMDHIQAEILTLYSILSSNNKHLEIVWIKGHSGIKPNEIVDQLAKSATTTGINIEQNIIPTSDLTTMYLQNLEMDWQNKYANIPTGNIYKQIQPSIQKKCWFHSITNRQFIRTLSRIRSNHALCPTYKYRIGQSDQPKLYL